MRKNIVTWLLFFLCTPLLHAQSPLFRHFGVREGLCSSEVYMMLEDSRNNIWSVTSQGVSRFDGTSFATYTTRDGLSDNDVINIYEDSRHRIWFMGITGLPTYYSNGKIHQLKTQDSTFLKRVYSVVEDKKGILYFGAYNGLLINRPNDSLNLYPIHRSASLLKLSGFGSDGKLWITGSENFLTSDDLFKTSKFINKVGLFNPYFQKVVFGYKSFDAFKDVYTIKDNRLVVVNDSIHRILLAIADRMKTYQVTFLKRDDKGNYWAGTGGNGLYFFDKDFRTTGKILNYLDGKQITSMVKDFEGNSWVSTMGEGLFLATSSNLTTFTAADGAEQSRPTLIAKGMDGRIWIAYANSKVQSYSRKEGFKTYDIQKRYTLFPKINSLFALDRESMLIGLDIGPIVLRNGVFQKFNSNMEYNLSLKCISMYGKDIFIGTHSNLFKLSNFNRKTLVMDSMIEMEKRCKIYPLRVFSLMNESGSTLLAGTDNGVYRVDHVNYTATKLYPDKVISMIPLDEQTTALCSSSEGVVIIRNGNRYVLDTKYGLPSNLCKKVYRENASIFWVITAGGLSRVKILNLAKHLFLIDSYNYNKGLASSEVWDMCFSGDTVWVATNNGITIFDKHLKNEYSPPPPVYITSVLVNDKVLPDLTQNQYLSYTQNSVRFSFTGISYKTLEKMLYRYKLLGLDTGWTYNRYPTAQYNSLPPNEYQFVVYARNSDGNWSREAGVFSFSISAPFWKTWWFDILVFIITSSAVFLLFAYRIRSIQNKEKEKTNLNKKIADIELKALRSQMNPHFTFNSLNAIQHYILRNDKETAHRYLSKFSRLMRIILEHSKLSSITIEDEINALNLYLELEALRFEKKFAYTINIDPGIYIGEEYIPSMLIQPYVENAIWHGLMHREEPGKILIQIGKEGEVLRCTIEDNGVGRQAARDIKAKKMNSHRSMGLDITQERLDILNQVYNSNVSVTIIDLKDENDRATGTRVEIFIPLT